MEIIIANKNQLISQGISLIIKKFYRNANLTVISSKQEIKNSLLLKRHNELGDVLIIDAELSSYLSPNKIKKLSPNTKTCLLELARPGNGPQDHFNLNFDAVLSESSTPKDLAKTISKLVETASPILYSYERIADNSHSTLTQRQIEILSLAAKGLSNKEIAKHLHLVEGTIKRHFSNIFKVLKVSNRIAAINSSHNTERLK